MGIKQVEFTPIKLTTTVDIYAIHFLEDESNEFHKFLVLFRSTKDKYLADDYQRILETINKISEQGALERHFRIEGKVKDRVFAIPTEIIQRNKKKHGTLRVYCIRVSDELLILGGGGLKVTDNYNEDEELSQYVADLQTIDKELQLIEDNGSDIKENIMNLTLTIN